MQDLLNTEVNRDPVAAQEVDTLALVEELLAIENDDEADFANSCELTSAKLQSWIHFCLGQEKFALFAIIQLSVECLDVRYNFSLVARSHLTFRYIGYELI